MDQLDEEIVELTDSGTIRYSSLAKKLGRPLPTIQVRVKKLEREGVIKRYKAEIDWKKAGLPLTALILVNIDINLLHHLKKSQDKLLGELLKVPYVKEGFIITGEADILLKVLSKDSEHLKDILLDHIDSKEGVVKTKTMIVLD